MKSEKKTLIWEIFLCLLLFVITYQIMIVATGEDSSYHVIKAQALIESNFRALPELDTNHPLWVILVAFVSICSRAPVYEAAAIATGILNSITYIIVYKFLEKTLKRYGYWLSVLAFALLLMGPFYISWYNADVYLGQGTPNTWHNPTAFCIRPLALITFWLILELLRKYEEKEVISRKSWFVLSGLLVLCNLAKPSFMQIMIPGLGLYLIYLLVITKGKSLLFSVKIASTFVPGVCLLFWQAMMSFGDSGTVTGGIEIALFEVMKYYSPNIIVSLLLGYLFPLYVLVTNIGILKERDIRLTLMIWISGFLEMAVLAEKGDARYDFNFSWGHLLAMFFVYLMALKYFLQYNEKYTYENRKERYIAGIGWGIFVLQFFIGAYYIQYILGLYGF